MIHLKKKSIAFETSCVYILWCMVHLIKKLVASETSHLYSVVYRSHKEENGSFRNVVCVYNTVLVCF